MFITDEKHHNTQFLANLSCDEKSICIPLPNKICNSGMAIPRRFPVLWNGKLPLLEDRGRKNLYSLGPLRISRNGTLFHSAHFSGFTGISGIIFWKKPKIPTFGIKIQ